MSDAVVYNEALLVGDIEATFRLGGTPDLLTDTYDVGPVSMSPDFSNLQRTAQRATFSPAPTRTGRRQMQYQFTMDLAGSGVTDGSKAPAFGRMLRACGFAETQFASAGLATARRSPDNTRTAAVTLAAGGTSAYTGTHPRLVVVTMTAVDEATVSAVATPTQAAYEQTAVSVATATEFAGPEGSKLMMTFTGSLVVGDKYFFLFVPAGYLYTPISDPTSTESMYFRLYEANKYHLLTGARGTFSLAATAGEYGQLQFTFTGDYNPPQAATFPALGNYSYGDFPLPPMVEQAFVQSNGRVLACPTTYGFDLGGNVSARLCANATGANDGAIITGRQPTASFNMDAVPLNVMDPWGELVNASQLQIMGNVGTDHGNMLTFLANGQHQNVQPAELDGLRKYDASLRLAGIDGNDELMIFVS